VGAMASTLRAPDSAGPVDEGVQETREVLAQSRPQFVAGPGRRQGGVLVPGLDDSS
jgi:hypothetical protein